MEPKYPHCLRFTETLPTYKIEENILASVVAAAVWSEGQRKGIWQKMIYALNSGADKTKEGTASAFLFQAMVNALLEEFHALESDQAK